MSVFYFSLTYEIGYLSSVLFIIQEGTVLSYDPISGAVSVELTKESLKKTQGKFGVL